MSFADYVSILDWTGRSLSPGKRGAIRGEPAALSALLGVPADKWLEAMRAHGLRNFAMLGRSERVQGEAARRGQQRAHGQGWARSFFRSAA